MGDLLDLARALVALPCWEWRMGMSTPRGAIYCGEEHREPVWWEPVPDGGEKLPDLRDPATLGALLGLLREVLGEPCLCTTAVRTVDGLLWTTWPPVGGVLSGSHPTEAHALYAAFAAVSEVSDG